MSAAFDEMMRGLEETHKHSKMGIKSVLGDYRFTSQERDLIMKKIRGMLQDLDNDITLYGY